MKKLLVLIMLGMSFEASAWISSKPMDKAYTFHFSLKGETFDYKQSAGSYEEAFENAAKACFKHYKGGRRISEDRGLDIIDVCANPRTT